MYNVQPMNTEVLECL